MKDIRIAAAVCNCPLGALERNLTTVERLTRRAAGLGATLICFPELNLTGYATGPALRQAAVAQDAPVINRVGEIARDSGLVILAGLAMASGESGRIYAEHRVFWPDGRCAAYRKLHLAPHEQEVLSSGAAVPLFAANGVRFGIQLCYDVHFPELSTAMALAGAEMIFIPHASPRGTPRAKLTSWLRCLPARSFDNGIFVVACNQTGLNGAGLTFPGVAVAVGPDGTVLARRTEMKEGLLAIDLSAASLARVRGHRMRYFLPHRRPDLYAPLGRSKQGPDR
jgi:predicted amidohydrolase